MKTIAGSKGSASISLKGGRIWIDDGLGGDDADKVVTLPLLSAIELRDGLAGLINDATAEEGDGEMSAEAVDGMRARVATDSELSRKELSGALAASLEANASLLRLAHWDWKDTAPGLMLIASETRELAGRVRKWGALPLTVALLAFCGTMAADEFAGSTSTASTASAPLTWVDSVEQTELALGPEQAMAVVNAAIPTDFGSLKTAASFAAGLPDLAIDAPAEVYPERGKAVASMSIRCGRSMCKIVLQIQRHSDQSPEITGPGPLQDGKPPRQLITDRIVREVPAAALIAWAAGRFAEGVAANSLASRVTGLAIKVDAADVAAKPFRGEDRAIKWQPRRGFLRLNLGDEVAR